MISTHCLRTGSRLERLAQQPFHPRVFVLSRSASIDETRNRSRSGGVPFNTSSRTGIFRHASSTFLPLVSCVTGPVLTGRATQPKHRITGHATQPETGRLTQLGGGEESKHSAFVSDFPRRDFLPTNCSNIQTTFTMRRSESPSV
jgi:hypothetical protein